jgi:hypothetical protein
MVRVIQVVLAALLGVAIVAVYRSHLWWIAAFAATHLLFPVLLAVVFGMVYGLVGADYGLASLFWHDRLRTRVASATAVTLLLALAGNLAFYSVAGTNGGAQGPDPSAVDRLIAGVAPGLIVGPAPDEAGRLGRFLIAAGAPFLLLLLAPALLPAAFPRVPRSAPDVLISRERIGPALGRTMSVTSNPLAYALGLLAWAAGIALGIYLVALSIRWAETVGQWLPIPGADGLDAGRRSLLSFGAVLVLFYAVLSFRPIYETVVSPSFAICALLGLCATAYAGVAYIFHWSLPGGMLLIAAGWSLWFALANADPYKLRFPEMTAYYPGGRPGLLPLLSRVEQVVGGGGTGGGGSGGLPMIRDEVALENWARVTGDGGKPKLVVLAVSGGALRSGLWVATVLDRIEQRIPDFGRHVRIITGASGGMVGAGYYLLHRRQGQRAASPAAAAGPYRPSPWVLSIPRNSLDPVARFMALRDPFLGLLPRIVADDRGIRLEEAWTGLGIPFRELGPEEQAGQIPSMILSPMMIEDGRRLLISNLDLGALIEAAGPALTPDGSDAGAVPYSLSALEFYRLFPEAPGFRLATGIRMNASFAYVSPSVSLPCDPPRRVFDAGSYDNYGVQVATAWLHKNFDWLTTNTSGIVLVQIRDAISDDARLGVADLPSGWLDRLGRGFQFFTSAPEAVESARTASAVFRNDEDVADVAGRFNAAAAGRDFFTTVIFENSAQVTYRVPDPDAWPGDEPVDARRAAGVPLNWYISRAERDSLFAAIPSPGDQSPWRDRARRLARIDELRSRTVAATGDARTEAVTQLEQAQNYERLVRLDEWWRSGRAKPRLGVGIRGDWIRDPR